MKDENTFDGISLGVGSTLEIQLTNNDLEHIANGYEVTLDIKPNETVNKIVIKPSVVNDILNPLINYDKKIVSEADLEIRQISREIARNSFAFGSMQWALKILNTLTGSDLGRLSSTTQSLGKL